ncbi:hypothetical protein NQ315_003950, partial [Exocentrus adspersus]
KFGNAREDRLINLSVRRRRTLNASQIKARLQEITGTIVSTTTIRDHLHERGLNARRRAACLSLQSVHRVSQRIWAQAHLNSGIAEWRCCMFTDECRFALYKLDGRMLVWRERNERYIEENMDATFPFGGGSVTVWSGVMKNGKTDLLGKNGKLFLKSLLQTWWTVCREGQQNFCEYQVGLIDTKLSVNIV